MNKKKRNLKVAVIGMMMMTMSGVVQAAEPTNLQVVTRTIVKRNYPVNSVIEKSSQVVHFTDETGKLISLQGRTYVPLKVICDALGIKTSYNPQTRATEIGFDDIKIELFNGNHMAKINGNWKALDTRDGKVVKETTCRVIEGRTYVPLRFISEELGLNVVTKGNTIYLDKIEKLIRMEDMQPGKVYKIGEVLYEPLKSYQPSWNETFLGAFLQEGDVFDFEKNTMTYHTSEELKEGVLISDDVMLYGVEVEGDFLKVELSKPVHPQIILFRCSPDELSSEELNGYSGSTAVIEELPNGHFLATAMKKDPRYKNIKHIGVKLAKQANAYGPKPLIVTGSSNTLIVDVDF